MTRKTGPILLAVVVVAAAGACGALALRSKGGGGAAPSGAMEGETRRKAVPFAAAETVLDGKLGNGWQDWGWGPHEAPDTGSILVVFESFGGILLHHDTLPSRYGALVFRYRAPKEYGDFLEVSLKHHQADETTLPRIPIGPDDVLDAGDGWKEVLVPWSTINPKGMQFDQINIQARRSVGPAKVALDKIVLTKPLAGAAGQPVSASRTVKLSVRCDEPALRIDPRIYGIANAQFGTGSPARRVGGNPLTRMNWDLGAWNTGSDWFFENYKSANTIAGWIKEGHDAGVQNTFVVPIIGWVAKDTSSSGFPISKLGAQQKRDEHRPDSGDGFDARGKPIRPGPPTETSIAAPPDLIKKWITAVRDEDRKRNKRGIDMYILDNEPNLWNTTHRDVHPDPLTYDELLDRTLRYGTAIREADPEAVIAGPAEWGWTGYFYSAKDSEGGQLLRLDRRAHGDEPLVAWYLKKLAEHEQRTKTRILDILDLHFYPQAGGIYGGGARTDPEGAELRIRSTRALWDPTYRDESWIEDAVELIPRMKKWVRENYPGRGTSLGEWSFGAEEHVSGGLATAEALGRFGQQGLTSAFFWLGPNPGTPTHNAFRAYRNYDGKGAKFLDWSVPTKVTDGISLFASRDDSGTKLVLVLLNLDPHNGVDADIDVATCGVPGAMRVFDYLPDTPGFVGQKDPKHGGTTFRERIASYAMKVIEVPVQKAAVK